MIKSTKKAFTLVELIVVVTILAILGTIAFISLQGYSAEARDSKRLSDVRALLSKVTIEDAKYGTLSGSITGSNISPMLDGGTQTNAGKLGTIDFLAIKENNDSFKDPSNGANYLAAYAVYGSGTGAYRFIQIATISEAKNTAVVVGNYFKIATNDDSSLIYTGTVLVVNGLGTTSTGTYNGTSTPTGLPYSIN